MAYVPKIKAKDMPAGWALKEKKKKAAAAAKAAKAKAAKSSASDGPTVTMSSGPMRGNSSGGGSSKPTSDTKPKPVSKPKPVEKKERKIQKSAMQMMGGMSKEDKIKRARAAAKAVEAGQSDMAKRMEANEAADLKAKGDGSAANPYKVQIRGNAGNADKGASRVRKMRNKTRNA